MNALTAAKKYQDVNNHSNISEASPHQLINMLIDGALARLAAAKGAITHGDMNTKGTNLGKSIDIISALQGCLDMDAGGELSNNLDRLYDYMIRRLAEASRDNDPSLVDEVSVLLKEIKEGWEGIPSEFHHLSSASHPQQAQATP